MTYVADAATRLWGVRGLPGALLYLGIVASGGVMLGIVTGFSLRRLFPASFVWRAERR
jgi:hypothetical protein